MGAAQNMISHSFRSPSACGGVDGIHSMLDALEKTRPGYVEPLEAGAITNLIGIGGGVGPAAGVALHQKIIENTLTDGTDQSHFDVMHFSRSSDVKDRTAFLLGKSQENPGEGMARTMLALNASAQVSGDFAVAGVPCNTFHAQPIWNRFVEHMQELGCHRVRVVHMLEETVASIAKDLPECKVIGLMSTTGTRETGVYRSLLEPAGYKVVEVEEELQPELHDTIYNREWGIKAVFPVSEKARSNFTTYARRLVDMGAEAVILGCTEIPLAMPEPTLSHGDKTVPLVDPVKTLARALIREANAERLQKA